MTELERLIISRETWISRYADKEAEIKRLKTMLTRAADALEATWANPEFGLRGPMRDLIAELRKAVT